MARLWGRETARLAPGAKGGREGGAKGMKIAAAFLAARVQDDDLAALRAGDIASKCTFPTAAAVCCGAKSAPIGTLANGLHIPIQNRGEKAIFPASSQIMSGPDGEVLIGPQPGAPGRAMRSGRCDHGDAITATAKMAKSVSIRRGERAGYFAPCHRMLPPVLMPGITSAATCGRGCCGPIAHRLKAADAAQSLAQPA